MAIASPLRFSALSARACGVARSGGRIRVESCDSAFSHVPCMRRSLNEQDRIDSSSRSSSVRRAGAVGETDSSHVSPARSRRTRRSSCSIATPLDLAARAGHAPTRPLRAAFRYPHPGAVARPCRTSGPSLLTLPRPAALLGFVPFAGLIPHPGGHASLPDRAHVPFVPIHPRPDLFSSG